jgi:hypothetical protein
MYYEPDTVWGRTVAGDHEISVPRSGLSIAQRRMLGQLGQPRTFATLAARSPLDAPKLEHELVRLAQLQLVAFQRPGTSQPRTAPRIDLPLLQMPPARPIPGSRRCPSVSSRWLAAFSWRCSS